MSCLKMPLGAALVPLIYSQGCHKVPTFIIRFVLISFLFASTTVFSADDVLSAKETGASNVAQKSILNYQLPEWFYRELSSISKDVSVLDATGASKEQIQELKERIGKVEVRLEETQLRIEGRLSEQSGRIGDIADSSSFSISLFSIVAGVLGTLIAVLSLFLNLRAKREAVASAKEEAKNTLDEWTGEKESEITRVFDIKLNELRSKYERELEEVRDKSEEQSADNDITEAYMLAHQKRDDEGIRRIHYVIQRFWGSSLLGHQKILAKAMYYRGLIFYVRNQPEKEILAYDELCELFNGHAELSIQENVAKALTNKGFRLGQLGYPLDEIAVCDEMIQIFKGNDELVIQELVAQTLVNKGARLGDIGRLEDAIVVYDELIQRFENKSDISIESKVSIAFVNKVWSLAQLDRLKEAIDTSNELDNRFKGRKELDLEEQVAKNLINKGNCLGKLYGPERAIQLYNELITRFKDRKEPSLEEEFGAALLNKGFSLTKLSRSEEAIAAYDELIKRFKDHGNAEIQVYVVDAICSKAQLVLATQTKHQAVNAIQNAISLIKEKHIVERAVMEMLKFIAEESTADNVLREIDNIPESEIIEWEFDEARHVIESLDSPRKEQVEAFARFFEAHHDIATLKEELELISNT